MPADAELLANLLELYIHDLSAVFLAIELGESGRFGYEKLGLYFSDPERHIAFVIRSAGGVAGFAFATRGSSVTNEPNALSVLAPIDGLLRAQFDGHTAHAFVGIPVPGRSEGQIGVVVGLIGRDRIVHGAAVG